MKNNYGRGGGRGLVIRVLLEGGGLFKKGGGGDLIEDLWYKT